MLVCFIHEFCALHHRNSFIHSWTFSMWFGGVSNINLLCSIWFGLGFFETRFFSVTLKGIHHHVQQLLVGLFFIRRANLILYIIISFEFHFVFLIYLFDVCSVFMHGTCSQKRAIKSVVTSYRWFWTRSRSFVRAASVLIYWVISSLCVSVSVLYVVHL